MYCCKLNHNYLNYFYEFFNLFSAIYLCFLLFSYKVFSLYIEISLWQYNWPSRKHSFPHDSRHGQGRGQSTCTHISQTAARSYIQDYTLLVIRDKTHLVPNPRSDSKALQVLLLWDIWLWFCFSCVPCWKYHEASFHPCWTFRFLTHSLTIRPVSRSQPTLTKANIYWLGFLLGTFNSNSGLRNNIIFILSSSNRKYIEAVNKVESFEHNSHTRK